MLGGKSGVRVFLYVGICDMRKQLDGLSTLVRAELDRDPENGDLFVFRNRRGDMIKILFYDALGCCLLCKRLHKATFRIAISANEDRSVEITHGELASLLANAEIVERGAQAA